MASFTDLSINQAASGYTLAASSGGLIDGTSAAFDIHSGAAAKLAFATQPGNAAAGAEIPGPPQVTVQDAFGNTVGSSTASITVTIGTNPGGGTLGGTTIRSATSGVASFNGLSIDQAAGGYTLAASSSGLTGATSSAFNITSGAGGTIAGIISGGGSPIEEALVELLQAGGFITLVRTPSNGSYSFSGLSPGSYDVRASAPHFAAQQESGISVTHGTTSGVDFSLISVPGLEIKISSPPDDVVIERPEIWVLGQASAPAGIAEVTVNAEPAQVNDGVFGALAPVHSGANALSAFLTDSSGNVAIDTIIVTRQEPEEPDFFAIWDGLKDALRVEDVTGALQFIIYKSRERYQGLFAALGPQLVDIDQILTDIFMVQVRQDDAEFEMIRSGRSFYVHFAKDDDGIWRLASF